MDEQTLLTKFDAIERESLEERLRLVRDAFPEIWHDAEVIVSGRRYLPWEFGAGFQPDAQALRDKYQFPLGRSRPRTPGVSARAALFCATCDLLDKLRTRTAAE